MRFFIIGKNKSVIVQYRKQIKQSGLAYTDRNPDIVIALGGDGTLLYAERLFPGIPKLPIRNRSICHSCDWNSLSAVLGVIRAGRYRIVRHRKLEAVARTAEGAFSKTCLNDFVIRNIHQTEAIRFTVRTGKKSLKCIGDGIVVSTPFGSSGYFYSIARRTFANGMGIAFNNLTRPVQHRVAKNQITFSLTRNRALLSADNDPDMIELDAGDTVRIRQSKAYAQLIKI